MQHFWASATRAFPDGWEQTRVFSESSPVLGQRCSVLPLRALESLGIWSPSASPGTGAAVLPLLCCPCCAVPPSLSPSLSLPLCPCLCPSFPVPIPVPLCPCVSLCPCLWKRVDWENGMNSFGVQIRGIFCSSSNRTFKSIFCL